MIDYEQQQEEDDIKLEELLKELTSKTEIESEEEDQDLIPEFQQEILNYKIKLENDYPVEWYYVLVRKVHCTTLCTTMYHNVLQCTT